MNLLKELLTRSTADGSRTNALNHLQWMVAAFAVLLSLAAWRGAQDLLLYFFGVVLIVFILCYLITHFYFMARDPDALRSETFKIQKMQIERGMIGDNRGVREVIRGQENATVVLTDQQGGGQ